MITIKRTLESSTHGIDLKKLAVIMILFCKLKKSKKKRYIPFSGISLKHIAYCPTNSNQYENLIPAVGELKCIPNS